jgi:putative membrane protein insertion efficiency factor
MKTVLLALLRAYQLGISPFLGQNCRFYPSCSQYAAEAIREHGALKGGLLATGRLCKCHPWHPGGVDPVPKKRSRNSGAATRPPLHQRDIEA